MHEDHQGERENENPHQAAEERVHGTPVDELH
jgi:hypothetical protein